MTSGETASDAGRRRSIPGCRLAVLFLLLVVASAATSPFWLTAWSNARARSALDRRRPESARRWLQFAIRLAPDNARSHFLLAIWCRRADRLDEAMRCLNTAREQGWPRERVDRHRALTKVQGGDLTFSDLQVDRWLADPGNDPDTYEAYARGLLRAFRPRLAMQVLSEWSRVYPQDAEPHYWMAQLSLEFADWEGAERHLRQALKIDPGHGAGAVALGELLLRQQRPDDALTVYRSASRQGGGVGCEIGVARCLRLLGEDGAARRQLKRVLSAHPDRVDAELEWAELDLAEGAFAPALARLDGVVQRDPRDAQKHDALARALRGVGRTEAAQRAFDRAAQMRKRRARAAQLKSIALADPRNLEARFEAARIHLEYGDAAEARIWLKRILELDPYHRPARQLLEGRARQRPP